MYDTSARLRVLRRGGGFLLVATALISACTTTLQPVKCTGGMYRCVEGSDVMFCEDEALSVAGADCAALGLAPSRPFCVVTHAGCVHTHYRVQGRDCEVVDYRTFQQAGSCSPGTPTFSP